MPAWYNHPATIADVENHIVGRVLDQLGIDTAGATRWQGLHPASDDLTLPN
ncbi:hypothetical protein E05_13390 [Plautia stali symbiont]|nr:hypothetical protein E05_13390 [Plautia stali symbiont]